MVSILIWKLPLFFYFVKNHLKCIVEYGNNFCWFNYNEVKTSPLSFDEPLLCLVFDCFLCTIFSDASPIQRIWFPYVTSMHINFFCASSVLYKKIFLNYLFVSPKEQEGEYVIFSDQISIYPFVVGIGKVPFLWC